MKYKAILWDLDGTLLDTLEDLADATNETLSHFGCPGRGLEQVRQFVGNGAGKLLERALPGGPADPPLEEALAWFREYYAAHCRIKTRPYRGIPELLNRLRGAGYQMAVLSNKPDEAVRALSRAFFQDTMALARGEAPDCPRKPDPTMARKAMAALGVTKEETVYVGDSEVDIATARAAGVPCISVLWGFRTEKELLDAGAACLCRWPEDLWEMV